MKFETAIFDLDGTLLNTLDDLANAANHTLAKYNLPTHETEKYKYFVGNGMKNLVTKILPENKREEPFFTEIYNSFIERYQAHFLDDTTPYDGICQLIDMLVEKGVKIAVVTNKVHDRAAMLIERFFGDKISITQGQVTHFPLKPDPTSALDVVKRLDSSADKTIFIGDSGVDMQTAKNGGFFAAGVLWGFRKDDELRANGADMTFSSPAELGRFILGE